MVRVIIVEKTDNGFGFKTPAGGLCAWAVQYTPPGELPNYRQFATLPTWLRSLCHVEREKTPFLPPVPYKWSECRGAAKKYPQIGRGVHSRARHRGYVQPSTNGTRMNE